MLHVPHGTAIVDRLAELLEYPSASFASLIESCRADAERLKPEVATAFERFAQAVKDVPASRLEELYTETFDLNAACTLDIGWHLFGERYDRGAFLAEVRPLLAAAGIPEHNELPDYLPRLLVLLSRSDPTRTAELRETVRRGVEKLTEALRERASPYEHLVASAFAASAGGA